ncbi:MAG: DUF4115 domain-containing protein [Bryobacteraceae bacterium]|nr:DUF4115 domain-containing protein [Bryobacteraceae bacterium]MDW8378316.1 DUF4115 domain-containing protein [Bryobacterales bacterium]
MATVGEILRRERERQGIGIAQIADQTRIKSHFLEAIENDNFAALPGVFFARAFSLQYARALGLNEEEIKVVLDRQVAPPDVSLVQMSSTLSLAEDRALSKPDLDPLPEGTASALSARKLTASVVALVAVIVACGAIFGLWQRSQLGSTSAAGALEPGPVTVIKGSGGMGTPAVSPPPAQPTSFAANPEGRPAAASSSLSQPANATLANASGIASPSTERYVAPPVITGKVNLAISSKEDTWVRITTDGKVVLARVITPSEPVVTAVANENAKVLLGNAAGVIIRFNGNDIGSIGPRGQVRTVEFTPSGFQILQPPPKSPPAGVSEPNTQGQTSNPAE